MSEKLFWKAILRAAAKNKRPWHGKRTENSLEEGWPDSVICDGGATYLAELKVGAVVRSPGCVEVIRLQHPPTPLQVLTLQEHQGGGGAGFVVARIQVGRAGFRSRSYAYVAALPDDAAALDGCPSLLADRRFLVLPDLPEFLSRLRAVALHRVRQTVEALARQGGTGRAPPFGWPPSPSGGSRAIGKPL